MNKVYKLMNRVYKHEYGYTWVYMGRYGYTKFKYKKTFQQHKFMRLKYNISNQ